MAGLSALTGASLATAIRWNAQLNQTGATYTPITNSSAINKSQTLGTNVANNVVGGADEFFSFQTGGTVATTAAGVTGQLSAGSSAVVNLNNLTNILNQAGVILARVKGYQIRLLSTSDDTTISPAPNANSAVMVTNFNTTDPSALDFGFPQIPGSGALITYTASAGALSTGFAITGGVGYPASTTLHMTPVGGPLATPGTPTGGGLVAVTINSSGVPGAIPTLVSGTGGAGYASAASSVALYPVGLTIKSVTVSSTAITAATIDNAGVGYPTSLGATGLLFTPVCGGTNAGKGAVLACATSGAGVPTGSITVLQGGSGYVTTVGSSSYTTVATVLIGQYSILTGGAHMYVDPSPNGMCRVDALSQNFTIYNLDQVNAVTVEITLFGATT